MLLIGGPANGRRLALAEPYPAELGIRAQDVILLVAPDGPLRRAEGVEVYRRVLLMEPAQHPPWYPVYVHHTLAGKGSVAGRLIRAYPCERAEYQWPKHWWRE